MVQINPNSLSSTIIEDISTVNKTPDMLLNMEPSIPRSGIQKDFKQQIKVKPMVDSGEMTMTSAHTKSLLISKLPGREYPPMKLPLATRVPIEHTLLISALSWLVLRDCWARKFIRTP